MNAADHLAKAEESLALSLDQAEQGMVWEEANLLLRALTHGVAAIAIELGVPPVKPPPAGDGHE